MSTTWEDVWSDVKNALGSADSIAFDGCHKIYVLMDKGQTEQMVEYEYENIVRRTDQSPDEMLTTVKQWFSESCGLRFVQAVSSPGHNENFESLIPQAFEEYERCYDCGGEYPESEMLMDRCYECSVSNELDEDED